MSRIVADLAQLAELADRMEVFQAHLARARDDVDARVQQVHQAWTGEAAAAQAAAHARWDAGAVEVHAALVTLRSIAATAHANYAGAVRANRRMWAGP